MVMKRAAFALLAAVVVGVWAAPARAEVCFRLTPFTDVLRLSQVADRGVGSPHVITVGNWITSSYSLPVTGAVEQDHGSTTLFRLGIFGANSSTSSFGGNPICELNGLTNGGPWKLACEGAATDPPFTNHGTALTPISCVGLPGSAPVNGPEAGEGR